MIIRCPKCRQTISTLDRHACTGQIDCPRCGLPDAELEPCRYCKRRRVVCRRHGCIWCRGLVPGSKENPTVVDGYEVEGGGRRIFVNAANDTQAKLRAAAAFARQYPGDKIPVRWRITARPKYYKDSAA